MCLFLTCSADEDFCYNNNKPCGPSFWGGACHNNSGRQSPVDITTDPYVSNPIKTQLAFHKYSTNLGGFTLVNTGDGIQLDLLATAIIPRIHYGNWGGYHFARLHFHWGENFSVGSEHTFNGTRTPMEIHLVHYSTRYSSLTEALASNDPAALAVIAIRVELSTSPINFGVDSFSRAMAAVSQLSFNLPGVTRSVHTIFKLEAFLPAAQDFFSYDGSFTIPPCYEIVKWVVMHRPVKTAVAQLIPFRTILTGKLGSVSGIEFVRKNYRPLQRLGVRKVEFNRAI